MKKAILFGLVLILLSSFVSATVISDLNDGAIVYYKLEENALNYVDATGNLSLTVATPPTRVAGILNFGQDFEAASSQVLETANNDLLATVETNNPFVCVWYKHEDTTTNQIIMSTFFNDAGSFKGWILRHINTNVFAWDVFGNGGNFDRWESALNPLAGTWYHICVSFVGGETEMFIDGVSNGAETQEGTATCDWSAGNQNLKVGRDGATFADGVIDEIYYGNFAGNSTHASFLYAGGSPNSEQQFLFSPPPFIFNLTNFYDGSKILNFTVQISNGTPEYLCYQEFANATSGCGITTPQHYELTPAEWTDPNNLIDGDYSTFGISAAGTAFIFMNYTKPPGALRSSLWQVKDDEGSKNLTIGDLATNCWDAWPDKILFGARSRVGGELFWTCDDTGNGDANRIIDQDSGSAIMYEEAMWWNTSDNITIKTTNGSIIWAFNETINMSVFEMSGQEGVFFNISYIDLLTNVSFTADTWQAEIRSFAIEEFILNVVQNFNVTLGGQFNTSKNNFTTHRVNAGTYAYSARANDFFYNATGTVSVSNLQNITNTILFNQNAFNISAFDIFSGLPINEFIINFRNVSFGIDVNVSTTTGSVIYNAPNGTYNVTIFTANYSRQSVLLDLNETLTSYNFTLFNVHDINFTFFEEITLDPLSGIAYEVFGDFFSTSGVSGASSIQLEGLPDGIYEIRYAVNSTTYSARSYFFSTPALTAAEINISLYLLNVNDSFLFNRVITDQNALPLEGNYVQVQRPYVSDDNTSFIYRVVEIALIDSQGNAVFSAVPNTQTYRLRILDEDLQIIDVKTPGFLIDAVSDVTANTQPEFMETFYQDQGITSTLAFDNVTSFYIYDYSDPSSVASICTLSYVLTSGANVSTSETFSSANSATLVLFINQSINGTYLVSATCTISGQVYVRHTATLNSGTSDNSGNIDILRVLGPILYALVMLLAATITSFGNPVFAIGLALLGTAAFAVSFLGMIYITSIFMGGLLIVGIAILWLIFNKK